MNNKSKLPNPADRGIEEMSYSEVNSYNSKYCTVCDGNGGWEMVNEVGDLSFEICYNCHGKNLTGDRGYE